MTQAQARPVRAGRIVGEGLPDGADEKTLGLMMAGCN